MILTTTQAKAVRDAMLNLGEIGARVSELTVCDGSGFIIVSMRPQGSIGVCSQTSHEEHRALGAFATAYGISDEPTANDIEARRLAVDAHAITIADSLRALRQRLA